MYTLWCTVPQRDASGPFVVLPEAAISALRSESDRLEAVRSRGAGAHALAVRRGVAGARPQVPTDAGRGLYPADRDGAAGRGAGCTSPLDQGRGSESDRKLQGARAGDGGGARG